MKAPPAVWKKLSDAHWEMLAVTGVLFVLVIVFVDLNPHVDENFFFATRDPNFPPTQRFGLVVLAGLIVDILGNLFVLPLLGGAQWKKK
jgi:uncharacterized integral membrane protein